MIRWWWCICLLFACLQPVGAAPAFCPQDLPAVARSSPLKVGIKYAPPFVLSDDKQRWKGLAIDLWETMSVCLGTRHEYIEFTSTDELLHAVESQQIDVALGAISITNQRERQLDFSHPFHNGSLGVIVRDVTQTRGFIDVLAGFFRTDVVLVVVGLMFATILIAYTYWRVEGQAGGGLFRKGPARGFYNATLWAIQLVFSGRGDPFEINHRAAQLFVLFLTFFGVTIVSGITAIITSSLTLQGIERRIHNVGDLKNQHLAVMITGQAGEWAATERLYAVQLRSWPEVQRQFDERGIDAFVHDRDILQFLVRDGYLKNVRVEPITLRPSAYGIAVVIGSPLRKPIDRTLLAIQEDRVWSVLTNKYLGSP